MENNSKFRWNFIKQICTYTATVQHMMRSAWLCAASVDIWQRLKLLRSTGNAGTALSIWSVASRLIWLISRGPALAPHFWIFPPLKRRWQKPGIMKPAPLIPLYLPTSKVQKRYIKRTPGTKRLMRRWWRSLQLANQQADPTAGSTETPAVSLSCQMSLCDRMFTVCVLQLVTNTVLLFPTENKFDPNKLFRVLDPEKKRKASSQEPIRNVSLVLSILLIMLTDRFLKLLYFSPLWEGGRWLICQGGRKWLQRSDIWSSISLSWRSEASIWKRSQLLGAVNTSANITVPGWFKQ